MKLLININSLNPPITGIGRYTTEILKYLIEECEITGFDPLKKYNHQQIQEKLRLLDEPNQDNVFFGKGAQLKKIIKNIPYAYKLRQIVQQKTLKTVLKQSDDVIYWEPNFILQPFKGKTVASIHDLSHLKYPQYHSKTSREWLERNLEETLNRADIIVTLSDFSKKEILQNFSIKEEKIRIVSPAVGNEFRVKWDAERIINIQQKYQLPPNYLLSVGTEEPRKNLKSLLKAYSQLPKQIKKDYPLVLVGAKGWGDLDCMIQPMQLKKEIILLGYIAQKDLPALYQAATLFLYLSLYEGYGMPVAEAMASGIAVITSEKSAMSEISGQAAKQLNPLDEQEITKTIKYYLENPKERQLLAEKGAVHMQGNTWKNSTSALQKIFNELN